MSINICSQAYLTNGGSDLRVLLNHETPYGCDTTKAALKSAIYNVITTGATQGVSFVVSMGRAYDTFRTKSGVKVTSFGGSALKWFCSGHVHEADTFGPGMGFVDRMYIFGEEAPASTGYVGFLFSLFRDAVVVYRCNYL